MTFACSIVEGRGGAVMNELKILVGDQEVFEEKLCAAGGVMGERYWVGNWYLRKPSGRSESHEDAGLISAS